jgi:hypothetical protein
MKRLGFLIVLAAVAAGGVVYTVHRTQSSRQTAVAALLPRGTIALLHLPDFNRMLADWHQTDIYKLYQEPAVQEFLNRPFSKVPSREMSSRTLADIKQLAPRDAFVAITSLENNNPHFVGGFRFRGSQANAEKTIEKWRSQIVSNASTREIVDYEQHKIEIAGTPPNQIATVYDGEWFFASNDLAEVKAALDRADGREKDRQTVLETEDNFHAAMAHMPWNYALLFYVQPQGVSEKLATLRSAITATGDRNQVIDQLHSVCGATRFDNGKMRDVLFVGMAQTQSERRLTCWSLDLGTSETFLYLAMLINPNRIAGITQVALPSGTWLQKVFNAAGRAGITIDDWKTAFDLELGSLADWPQDSRWPSIVATLPVKDFVRAGKVVDALAHAIDEDASWTKTEKNGVKYFYMQTPAALLAISPTIALSSRALIIGLDSVSVEDALKRAEPPARKSPGLSDSPTYKGAARTVPAPTESFVYVNMALLYSRLDAALRPMLLMSAAFMPAISNYVDVSKLPAPEIVTKHLGPIVSSQRYDGDGYVTESMGPITLSEAALGLGLPAVLWGAVWHKGP